MLTCTDQNTKNIEKERKYREEDPRTEPMGSPNLGIKAQEICDGDKNKSDQVEGSQRECGMSDTKGETILRQRAVNCAESY